MADYINITAYSYWNNVNKRFIIACAIFASIEMTVSIFCNMLGGYIFAIFFIAGIFYELYRARAPKWVRVAMQDIKNEINQNM